MLAQLIDQLLARVSDFWLAALAVSFFAMICESAKPKPAEGEAKGEPSGPALWVSIFSLVTPLLLFLHAFLSGNGSTLALIAAIGGAVIGAALIGWLIAGMAPAVGRVLNRAAPVLGLAAFALTLYVTWPSIVWAANYVVASIAR